MGRPYVTILRNEHIQVAIDDSSACIDSIKVFGRDFICPKIFVEGSGQEEMGGVKVALPFVKSSLARESFAGFSGGVEYQDEYWKMITQGKRERHCSFEKEYKDGEIQLKYVLSYTLCIAFLNISIDVFNNGGQAVPVELALCSDFSMPEGSKVQTKRGQELESFTIEPDCPENILLDVDEVSIQMEGQGAVCLIPKEQFKGRKVSANVDWEKRVLSVASIISLKDSKDEIAALAVGERLRASTHMTFSTCC